MKLKFYGSRGSIPFYSRQNIRYGGNTLCVRLDTAGRTIVLDCGSGLMQLHAELPHGGQKLDMLLGHLHIDHIIGLAGFSHLWDDTNDIRIYTKSRSALPLGTQIFGSFCPPYWPVEMEKLNHARLCEVTGAFSLGDGIRVTPFAVRHHNDTTAFRIDADRSVVYLLDCELDTDDQDELARLADYCRDADVVIFDATYLPGDYPAKRGWGHSSLGAAALLAEASLCKRMILAHFAQEYSDAQLDALAAGLSETYLLAYDGLELTV